MISQSENATPFDFEGAIAAFENHWTEKGAPKFDDFLPIVTAPVYLSLLEELVRIDIEFRWSRNEPRCLESYFQAYPDLETDPKSRKNIIFEAYRVRAGSSQYLPPEHFAAKYGIDVSDWPRFQTETAIEGSGTWQDFVPPQVGESVCGYQLLECLGSGGAGSVFVARQTELSNRLVAVKVSALSREPETLAQLQHTNIVPILSVRRDENRQVFCMPLLGVVTLADVFDQQSGHFSGKEASLQHLISTVAAKRAPTLAVKLSLPSRSFAPEDSILPGVHFEPKLGAIAGKSPSSAWVWFYLKLAEGVAHAHSNGIVHRDLKPANVLISDNGQPLILDFHLSTHLAEERSAIVGGTWPYMSPEQVQSLETGDVVDGRSDIYSFGVMLFQALTGKLPFPNRIGEMNELVQTVLQDRKAGITETASELGIRPSLYSIIKKCTHFEIEKRYQTAEQLASDLECCLLHRPLKTAPNLSTLERAKNWCVRHPRLSSATSIAFGSLLLVALVSWGFWNRGQRLARYSASQKASQFVNQAEEVIPRLVFPSQDVGATVKTLFDAVEIAESWPAVRESRLISSPEYLRLDDDEKMELHRAARRLNFWILRSANQLNSRTNPPNRERIVDLIKEAEGAFGRTGDAGSLDKFLEVVGVYQKGNCEEALVKLEPILQKHSNLASMWAFKSSVLQSENRLDEAEACLSVCVSLVQDPDWVFAQRGNLRYRKQKYELALSDFNEAIKLADNVAPYFLNRALCYMALGELQLAEADFDEAFQLGTTETRAYLLRSRVRNALGNREGALKDMEAGIRSQPSDELSWIARGIAQVRNAPEAAIRDFTQALTLSPKSTVALQNLAHVYAEVLGNPESAIEAMEKLVKIQPDDSIQRATLGVLRARTGLIDEAIEDATLALKLANNEETHYSVAGIFSLLSTTKREYAKQAVSHLRISARSNPQLVFEQMESDPDLTPIRQFPEFKKFKSDLQAVLSHPPESH